MSLGEFGGVWRFWMVRGDLGWFWVFLFLGVIFLGEGGTPRFFEYFLYSNNSKKYSKSK